jgi:gas vesicle protein GvpO
VIDVANQRRRYESDQRSRTAHRPSNRDKGAEIDDVEISVEDAAAFARKHIAAVTGRSPGTVISVDPAEDGWLVEVELVEQERIPTSLDVLAVYAVELDGGGRLVSYRRNRRYSRASSVNGARE